MEFVHRVYQPGETIAAIATPPGSGGIAIIRISGDRALDIADSLFSGDVKSYKTHTAHLGTIFNSEREKIDEALLLVMLGRRSFTGEDTVEIQCHGGNVIARAVLESAISQGARLALPGEFSFKAFMNGKLDLAQAEAIQTLIAAKNEKAAGHAHLLLEGALSKKIESFQKDLFHIAAIFEAWVDFPEEGLEFASMESILESLSSIKEKIDSLVATFHDGKKLHFGISLCIVGAPNVGKSSLLNALLDKERAIVTDIPGTTRDLLEEEIFLNGLPVRLIDTAGLRETSDFVEKEGIKRTRKAAEEADLLLHVLDASHERSAEENELAKALPADKTITIWNKIDLKHSFEPDFGIKISAKEKWGLDALKKKIDQMIWKDGPPSKEELLLSSLRHKEALCRASDALSQTLEALKKNTSPEFLVSDIRKSLFELGTIIGKNISEEILSSIFSQFCIGK